MPVSYRFDSNVLFIEPTGDYSPAELKQSLISALVDPSCPPTPSVLLNLGDCRVLLGRSSAEIIDMAEFIQSRRGKLDKVAIVADNTAAYGLVRMGSVYAAGAGNEPRVFREVSEALRWLTP